MSEPRIIIAIQARLQSTRLPGKILLPFCGTTMLGYQMQRLERYTPYEVLALVPDHDYLAIRAELFRHLVLFPSFVCDDDVLGRYANLCRSYNLQAKDYIIRITGDCPLLCPALLCDVVHAMRIWRAAPLDYYGMGPGWPDGLGDIDVITVGALLDADKRATEPLDREHTTPWIWNHPKMYRQALYTLPSELAGRHWPKFSVDTQGDFDYVHMLAQKLERKRPTGRPWTWRDVLALIANKPELAQHYEPMNTGYLEQLGVTASWDEIRYGSKEQSA